MRYSPVLRSIGIGALLCAGVAACGGGSGTSAPGGAGSGPSSHTTTAGSNGQAAGASATTARAASKSSGGGNFCALERDSYAKSHATVALQGAALSAALRKQYAHLRQTEQPSIDAAPDALRADVQLLVDASVKYGEALSKVDFDITRATEAGTSFSKPAVVQASTRVLTYLRDTCHLDFTAGATAPTSTP